MLAFQSFALSQPPHSFLPMCPSPLSPRSINIYGRRPAMNSTSADEKSPISAQKATPFAKRDVKKAPSPRSDQLREQRRAAFLKKVKDGRDDKRYELREEDMMRLEYVRQQRQWQASQAKAAPVLDADYEDFDFAEDDEANMDLPSSAGHAATNDDVDQFLQMEDEELEALLGYMPQEKPNQPSDQCSEHFGSDDDDYDELFMDMLSQEKRSGSNDLVALGSRHPSQDDSMDLS